MGLLGSCDWGNLLRDVSLDLIKSRFTARSSKLKLYTAPWLISNRVILLEIYFNIEHVLRVPIFTFNFLVFIFLQAYNVMELKYNISEHSIIYFLFLVQYFLTTGKKEWKG